MAVKSRATDVIILRVVTAALTLLFVALNHSVAQQPNQGTKPPFSIHISTSKDTVKAGTEIELKIVVKNISNHEIGFTRSNGKDQAELSYYTVQIRDVKGNSAPETILSRVLRGEDVPSQGPWVLNGSDVMYRLRPGDTLDDEMIVNKLFNLSEPGRYTIQKQRADDSSGVVARSNQVTISITP
jgi:hypothetical protein